MENEATDMENEATDDSKLNDSPDHYLCGNSL